MDQPTRTSSTRPVWRRLLHLRREAPLLYWFLLIWGLAEAGTAVLGPLVVPERTYLAGYLGEQARRSTEEFYRGEAEALVYDGQCGWRNRPGYERGAWRIDEHGARSTHAIPLARGPKSRILFLGSSLTNGGMGVGDDETISAAVEDSVTEALNFATMLYSLDQCYLAYRSRLRTYAPDVVVVGLSGRPTEGLNNRYVPFRMRSEVHMPYFKPRFEAAGGELHLLEIPSPAEALTVLESPDLLDRYGRHDAYAANFAGYKRFAHTPVTHAVWSLGRRARNLRALLRESYGELDLLQVLMGALVREAAADGAGVVFMFLPDREIVTPGWRGRLPDRYGHMIDRLGAAGFTVLDGRRVLLESGERPSRLYHRDRQHFSALGNRVLGEALKPLLAPAAQAGAAAPAREG